MKIDFHVHTVLSRHRWLWKYGLIDGINTPEEVAQYSKKVGLDAICITDHNHVYTDERAKKLSKKFDMLVVSGAEVDFEINGKIKEYIMLGCNHTPKGASLAEVAEYVHEEGGILIAPHPTDILNRGINDFKYFDAIEYINGFSGKSQMKNKVNKALVTGSDAHYIKMIGYSYTLIDANGLDELFEKIKKNETEPHGTAFPKWILGPYYLKKWISWVNPKRTNTYAIER